MKSRKFFPFHLKNPLNNRKKNLTIFKTCIVPEHNGSPTSIISILRFFPGCMELGEIYSLACDTNHVITGHTLTNSAFKIWDAENFDEIKVIKVSL